MIHRLRPYATLLSVFAAVTLAVGSSAIPASAQSASAQPTASPEDAIAKAFVLVDADTGNIISSHNEHVAMPPASITKLLTALTVLSRLKPTDEVVVASAKPESMPALKIGVRQGETWTVDRLLHGLLMVSANDAAVALVEASTGSLDNFVLARAQAAKDLGLSDSPSFNDPAGLDDAEWGYNGGDSVSARDMAIIARAALANDEIRSIVSSQRYDFTGLDGNPHHFLNHNGLLRTYSGAIGMKTGYTKKAGRTLVAAAERDGRTMIVVLLNSPNTNLFAAQLLDQGFATPVASESNFGQLQSATVESVDQNLAGQGDSATQGLGATGSTINSTLGDLNWAVVAMGLAFGLVLVLLLAHHYGEPVRRRVSQRRSQPTTH